jgi:DNA-directed RNA polymerase subunit L
MSNSLRRTSIMHIPTYAIAQETITIDVNTTVAFNNDYMKLRLATCPVYGVHSELYFLPEKYWSKSTVNYVDIKREKHPSEKNVEFYLNVHNNSSLITSVTTSDLKMYIDGEEIKNPYSQEYPILLIKLRPNDKFKCYMKGCLGVAERNILWNASKLSYHEEGENYNSNNELLLTIESNEQLHGYDILIKSCKFLIKKYTDLKNNLIEKNENNEIHNNKIMELVLDNEDYTVGGSLNYELQDHKDIVMSALRKPDNLLKSVIIKCEGSTKSPFNTIMECLDILIKKFSHIGKILSDMYVDEKMDKVEKIEKIEKVKKIDKNKSKSKK